MAADAKTPVEIDKKKSRTLYLTDAEWERINAQATSEGRGAGRHFVFIVDERDANKKR